MREARWGSLVSVRMAYYTAPCYSEYFSLVVIIIPFKMGKCRHILQGFLRVEPFWAMALL